VIRRNLIALLAALSLAACGPSGSTFQNTDLSAGALFPTASLVGADGQPRNLADFRGKVVIVLFGYTNCGQSCQIALSKYATLIRFLRTRDAERVQVVFISVDPERDSPERLNAFVRRFHPDFVGLSGDLQQIADFARQLKVSDAAKPSGEGGTRVIEHGTGAHVIDAKGQLRLAIGEDTAIEPIAADIRALLDEK